MAAKSKTLEAPPPVPMLKTVEQMSRINGCKVTINYQNSANGDVLHSISRTLIAAGVGKIACE